MDVTAYVDILSHAFVSRPHFRGCPFVNAVVELADRSHLGHVVALQAKKGGCRWFGDRLGELGVREPDTIARELLLVFEGALACSAMRGPQAAHDARLLAGKIVAAAALRRPNNFGLIPA